MYIYTYIYKYIYIYIFINIYRYIDNLCLSTTLSFFPLVICKFIYYDKIGNVYMLKSRLDFCY